MTVDPRAHWRGVHAAKTEAETSWHQEKPAISPDLIALAGAVPTSAIIDVGGGASPLVDLLLAQGFRDLTVLDLAEEALTRARERLGPLAANVAWIAADATTWTPPRRYDIWHDRAAFHFLTDASDRRAYLDRLRAALAPGGHAIIATFAPDGPEKCSGLPIVRYDASTLSATLGDDFDLVAERRHDHVTPWGSVQKFRFALFRRTAPPSRTP